MPSSLQYQCLVIKKYVYTTMNFYSIYSCHERAQSNLAERLNTQVNMKTLSICVLETDKNMCLSISTCTIIMYIIILRKLIPC